MTKGPHLTTESANAWLKSVLADPARASQLKGNWSKFLLSEFHATKEQVANIAAIPADHAAELQKAVDQVVSHGGSIHIDRASESSPGTLIVDPKKSAGIHADLSVGIFHCTFNAHCRNWHCGWGPARKT